MEFMEFKVEAFYIGSGDRVTADCWETEADRYHDLTVIDYLENTDWELAEYEKEKGIIVTLFIDGKPVDCVWWHVGKDGEEFTTVFGRSDEE